MSVADQSFPAAPLTRPSPFTVRFSPQFVNRLCDRLQESAPSRASVAGLLFGRSAAEVSEIHVFRSFPERDPNALSSPESERLNGMVNSLVAAARTDPELSGLKLLGWYSFRGSGGLHESDVAFHNRYFGEPHEIALILRPEQRPNVLFEIYSRAGSTLLSEEEHRWGSLRLATDATVAGPVDIAMRTKVGDQFYLRAYQVSKTMERAERRAQRATMLEAAGSRLRSVFRRRPEENDLPGRTMTKSGEEMLEQAAPPSLARAAAAGVETSRPAVRRPGSPAESGELSFGRASQRETGALQRIYAGDPPALPAVIKPPKRGIPWLSSVIVFAVAAGATFAVVYMQGFARGGETPRFLRAIFPDTGLGLRVEGQGDRVLLSWNRRNALVRASSGGILHIDDGAQHRDVKLDPAQIANGSVLYRPGSDDVSFRLEVHGQGGASVADTMRVLDGAKAEPLEAKAAPPDVSAAANPTAPAANAPTTAVPARAKTENRERREADFTPPRNSPQARIPASSEPAPTQSAKVPEFPQTAFSQEATPPPITVPSAATSTPAHTESSPPSNTANLAASRPVSIPTAATATNSPLGGSQPAPQGTKSGASAGSPELTRPADTAKVSNWEEAPVKAPEQGRAIPPPAVAPARPAAAPTRAPAAPEMRFPATFVPPKPTKQVLPDLHLLGPGFVRAASEVEVAVKVNKKGRVTEAYLVGDGSKVPPRLALAALSAAKQWFFKPATLHGKSVASDHTIVFEFRPASP